MVLVGETGVSTNKEGPKGRKKNSTKAKTKQNNPKQQQQIQN